MSDSLRPRGLHHTRLPCPSPSPRVCSNSWPLSWWCHPTISFSVVLLSSCLWPKYWSFSFSISPSNEYSGLISFRFDWYELLAVQEILKSLLQHHNLKASILWCSAFFKVQLSYPYWTAGKIIGLIVGLLLAKQCLCFLTWCLGLSQLFFHGASAWGIWSLYLQVTWAGSHRTRQIWGFSPVLIFRNHSGKGS